MSIFDNSLEPLKRMRRKARERRLLATQNVKDSLARRLEGDHEAVDKYPPCFFSEPPRDYVGFFVVVGV